MKLEVAVSGGHTLIVSTDDFATVEVSIGKPTDPETGLEPVRPILAFDRGDLPQLITALQAVDAAAAWDESRERVMPMWPLPTMQWPQADNIRAWERSLQAEGDHPGSQLHGDPHRGVDFRMGPSQEPIDRADRFQAIADALLREGRIEEHDNLVRRWEAIRRAEELLAAEDREATAAMLKVEPEAQPGA